MKNLYPLFLLTTLLGFASVQGRDVNRQKMRTLSLTYKRLREHPSYLALKNKTSLNPDRVMRHQEVLGKEVAAFAAQRTSYSSDRSTRLYKYRIEDMQELLCEAKNQPDAFVTHLSTPSIKE